MDEPPHFEDIFLDDTLLDDLQSISHEAAPALEIPQIDWTRNENKIFENTIAEFGEYDSETLFQNIALRISTKTVSQIKQHYEALLEDIDSIESDLVPIPDYQDSDDEESEKSTDQLRSGHGPNRRGLQSVRPHRRRGMPWTRKEHELFLEGLAKYGKGDWKSIARSVVKTRTSTQVASHAQKYFLKLQNPNARYKDGHIMKTKKVSTSEEESTTLILNSNQSLHNMSGPSSVAASTPTDHFLT
ncbi:Transcription factor DIVARICATA like [Quillaja saponaria]|uniref:Transcription factor DIVARICATA like n=1 Tax=Quillaja saponaria TaxID=32244 RepID=A0AAD7L3D9_QUISA|nr:Transcription factor DIVARICATA like [Quillaja saponaria]